MLFVAISILNIFILCRLLPVIPNYVNRVLEASFKQLWKTVVSISDVFIDYQSIIYRYKNNIKYFVAPLFLSLIIIIFIFVV